MLAEALTLLHLAVPSVQAAPPQFSMLVLDSSGSHLDKVIDVNAAGESVGYIVNASTHATATYWNAVGERTILGRERASSSSTALAINDSGVMVGYGYGNVALPFLPILWTLADGGSPIPGPKDGMGLDVNAGGDILLHANTPSGFMGILRKRDGTSVRIEFPSGGVVRALSNDRRVTGDRTLVGIPAVAFRWSEAGGFEDLEVPLGQLYASGRGISPDGSVVVGWASDGSKLSAVAWDTNGKARILPSSLQLEDTRAAAVNAAGWVVGTQTGQPLGSGFRPFGTLWVGGVAHLLDDLVQTESTVEVHTVTSINDSGQIVASALVDGQPKLIRLDPL